MLLGVWLNCLEKGGLERPKIPERSTGLKSLDQSLSQVFFLAGICGALVPEEPACQ